MGLGSRGRHPLSSGLTEDPASSFPGGIRAGLQRGRPSSQNLPGRWSAVYCPRQGPLHCPPCLPTKADGIGHRQVASPECHA